MDVNHVEDSNDEFKPKTLTPQTLNRQEKNLNLYSKTTKRVL